MAGLHFSHRRGSVRPLRMFSRVTGDGFPVAGLLRFELPIDYSWPKTAWEADCMIHSTS